MAYSVEGDLMISINSFKQGSYYVICVSSVDDIRNMNWVLGDRKPTLRTSEIVEDIYLVRLVYPEKYFVYLQLRREIIQEKYTGVNLVEYLMTDSTYYGFFEEQEAYYREKEMRKFFFDIAVITAAIIGGAGLMMIEQQ